MGNGEIAPNPSDEVVNFDTTVFSLRYGLSGRINLIASLPYYSIESTKFQGAPYQRLNRGLGDMLVTGEMLINSSPQVTVEAGFRFPTGNVDKTDELGQRICDILALGSGTTDVVVGSSIWLPHVGLRNLSVVGRIRHRFAGGQNKWGYQFGDETDFSTHAVYPFWGQVSMGLRVEGYRTDSDTWYGNTVPERGATMVYTGPTATWTVSPDFTIGAFARFPVLMSLEGSQMVSPAVLGLEFSTNLTAAFDRLRQR